MLALTSAHESVFDKLYSVSTRVYGCLRGNRARYGQTTENGTGWEIDHIMGSGCYEHVEAGPEYELLRLGKTLFPGWVEAGIDFAGYSYGRRFPKRHMIEAVG